MKRNFLIGSLFYGLVFMGGSLIATFLTLYFTKIGLEDDVIGVIMACGSGIMLISQPFWGTIGDRAKSKNTILLVVIVVSSLLMLLYPLVGVSALLIGLVTVALNFFSNAIAPLSDTITLELAKQEGFRFSNVRMMGSLGFAVMALVGGQLLSGNIFLLFPLFVILRVSSLGALWFLPKIQGHAREMAVPAKFRELFQDKKLVIFYVYAFLLSMTWAFFNTFYPVYTKQIGFDPAITGLGITIGSLSQFPFMFFFDRLYRRFGIVNILLVSGVAYAVRWLLFATALNSVTIVPIMLMHGLNYIIIYLCLTEYVGSNVGPALKTRGQMTNSLVLFGISAIVGNLTGGFLAKGLGLNNVFLASAVICAAAVIGLFISTKVVNRRLFASLRPSGRSTVTAA